MGKLLSLPLRIVLEMKKVSINYKNLHKEIEKGATILLNDGKMN